MTNKILRIKIRIHSKNLGNTYCKSKFWNKAKLPTHVELDSSRYALVKDSVVLLEQLRTIDKKRLRDKVCHLDREILRKVERALLISLDLNT